MAWYRRVYMTVTLSAALTVLAAPASAQTQVTYRLAGVEIAATSVQGTFTGLAISTDDVAAWAAVVLHQPLDDTALVTGGTFALDGEVRNLEGLISEGEKSYD